MISQVYPRACLRACSRVFPQLPRTKTGKPSSSTRRPVSQWHPQTNTQLRNRLRPLPRLPAHQQIRHKTFRAAARDLYKEYPLSVSLASFCIITACLGLIYANYVYQSYIIGEFSAYPEPIARLLRRALFYSNHDVQPENAVKYYTKALDLAKEMGLDPLSDEILGVKFQLASFLEKQVHQPKLAIDVLERVKAHCVAWIEEFGGLERQRGKRTRVLGQVVRVSVKLGELYASPEVMETEHAEESLVWAVTTLLKEQERREREGVMEGEGEWIGAEEIGGALESLANHYESRSQHYLATPLYLQAVSLISPRNCHAVTLMTNLSASLSQQLTSSSPYEPPVDRAALTSNARTWAQKALETASAIQPPDRTAECDEGCAVAMHNLGEIAEMDGNIAEARRRYVEAESLSKAIGFGEGVKNSRERLRFLKDR
ncbi:MAG: hypothetical protein LQ338_004177 [Usnochroma carphineum]|nr:MAG: hypothetical protein LQ338_004177 [Usnochroma carphineum]